MKQNRQKLPTAVAMVTTNRVERIIISVYRARACSINTPTNSIICCNSYMWHGDGAKKQITGDSNSHSQHTKAGFYAWTYNDLYEMRGSHGGEYENYELLGCDVM
jgi:hypothetical protein